MTTVRSDPTAEPWSVRRDGAAWVLGPAAWERLCGAVWRARERRRMQRDADRDDEPVQTGRTEDVHAAE